MELIRCKTRARTTKALNRTEAEWSQLVRLPLAAAPSTSNAILQQQQAERAFVVDTTYRQRHCSSLHGREGRRSYRCSILHWCQSAKRVWRPSSTERQGGDTSRPLIVLITHLEPHVIQDAKEVLHSECPSLTTVATVLTGLATEIAEYMRRVEPEVRGGSWAANSKSELKALGHEMPPVRCTNGTLPPSLLMSLLW